MMLRVVFDTNVVISALLFQSGELAWLRAHWARQRVAILASNDTVAELVQVLAYPKFRLESGDIQALLGDYLPPIEIVPRVRPAPLRCRDPGDQQFLDLAVTGCANVLVSGDKDLRSMAGLAFVKESPAAYRGRFSD
jgi:putative PIN family toxin of toxin-antitoxin system